MSRGFDSFDIDDFHRSDSGSERGMGGGSNSSWDKWRELQNIYREEERSDALARDGQQRFGRERPPVPREERVREVVQQRVRTSYIDRNKSYSLRDPEIHTLSEVGKFRVVAKNDLAEFTYNGDRDRMENDVENLVRQYRLGEFDYLNRTFLGSWQCGRHEDRRFRKTASYGS